MVHPLPSNGEIPVLALILYMYFLSGGIICDLAHSSSSLNLNLNECFALNYITCNDLMTNIYRIQIYLIPFLDF